MDPRRHRVCFMCDAPVDLWDADVHIRSCVWIAARLSAREELGLELDKVYAEVEAPAPRRRWGRG